MAILKDQKDSGLEYAGGSEDKQMESRYILEGTLLGLVDDWM